MSEQRFARERREEWAPISNRICVGEAKASRWGTVPLTWSENGQSASCSWCGSMSSEEVLECLDLPYEEVRFSTADNPWKFYLTRYNHAGDCIPFTTTTEHPGGGKTIRHACACEVKRGGGPIKFYAQHLADGARPEDEFERLLLRIRVRAAEDSRRFQGDLDKRMRDFAARGAAPADTTEDREGRGRD